MASPSDTTGPINIGNPVESTIKELAETIIAMVGGKSELIFNPLPQDDPKQRKPDITLARNKLGWEPKVKLHDGLSSTVDYFKKFLAV
jgi:UDP-glucuronate decarboxylase